MATEAYDRLLHWLGQLSGQEKAGLRLIPNLSPGAATKIRMMSGADRPQFSAIPNPEEPLYGRGLIPYEKALLPYTSPGERLRYYLLRDKVLGLEA